MDRGILYIAIGKKHVEEARYSAETARTYSRLPVTLITNVEGVEGFDYVHLIPVAEYDPLEKIRGIASFPFAQTLFLDTDTRVLQYAPRWV